MIALDTNVLARFYLNDEPAQARVAARLLMEEDVLIPKTVLLELEWVMRGVAHVSAAGIAKSMAHLLSLPNVHIEDESNVRLALKAYAKGLDFADALHVHSARGATRFATFDRKLTRRALPAGSGTRVALAK